MKLLNICFPHEGPTFSNSFFQGEQGVTDVLQKLQDELKTAMALAGVKNYNVQYTT